MAKVNIRDSVIAELEARHPSGTLSDKVLKLLATVEAYESMGKGSTPQPVSPPTEPDQDKASALLDNIL